MSKQRVQIEFQEKIIVTSAPIADNFWMRLSGCMFSAEPHVAGILFESLELHFDIRLC